MDITVIGAGYVGLTSAAVFADFGHSVTCLETNIDKINMLEQGKVPIYEPGLEELIKNNRTRLTYSLPTPEIINRSSVILIAVGTPMDSDGQTDLTFIKSVIDLIANSITSHKTIITKSTVPPGTNEWIYETLIEKGVDTKLFHVVSNPEFLREGTAISDMIRADKIVVGKRQDDNQSLAVIKEMYHKIDAPIIETTLSGAEMIKYASNAFLATKISFINEMARICDQYSVDIEDVVKGISTDPRISPHFLKAGIGYGGSCFPKDVRSLEFSATKKNVQPLILQAVQTVNRSQVDLYIDKLKTEYPNFADVKIAVLGIAFKPNTDDIRYSPAVKLIDKLSELQCKISAYDPEASLPKPFKKNVEQEINIDKVLRGANCVIIATDWKEFLALDWKKVKKLMNGDLIVDARNCIDRHAIEKSGLRYLGVARP